MPSLQAQPSINDLRTQAHLRLGARLESLDLTQLFIYANPSASVLPFLAWQLDAAGPYWQLLAGTGGEQQLVEQAIALHKISGTPAAIEQLIGNTSLSLISILEGQNSWGGDSYSSDEGWAVFRVVIGLAYPFTPAQQSLLQQAIEYFAPERCWLDQVIYVPAAITDAAPVPTDIFTLNAGDIQIDTAPKPTDYITAPAWPISDIKTTVVTHDAHFQHAGLTHSKTGPALVDSGLTLNGVPIEGSP